MPLIAFTFVLLFGVSVNSHNAGGVASFDEAKSNIIDVLKNPQPADYSKLND